MYKKCYYDSTRRIYLHQVSLCEVCSSDVPMCNAKQYKYFSLRCTCMYSFSICLSLGKKSNELASKKCCDKNYTNMVDLFPVRLYLKLCSGKSASQSVTTRIFPLFDLDVVIGLLGLNCWDVT